MIPPNTRQGAKELRSVWTLVQVVYRAHLRLLRKKSSLNIGRFYIVPPVDRANSAPYFRSKTSKNLESLALWKHHQENFSFASTLRNVPADKWVSWLEKSSFTSAELRCLCRNITEHICHDEKVAASEKMQFGLASLDVFPAMLKLSECVCVVEPENNQHQIGIEITTFFAPKLSAAPSANFGEFNVFFYRLQFWNHGSKKVKLLARSWEFRNTYGEIEHEVKRFAPGVVGKQPDLEPWRNGSAGKSIFNYVSSTYLTTDSGTMSGAFQFEEISSDDSKAENNFVVELPETRLSKTN